MTPPRTTVRVRRRTTHDTPDSSLPRGKYVRRDEGLTFGSTSTGSAPDDRAAVQSKWNLYNLIFQPGELGSTLQERLLMHKPEVCPSTKAASNRHCNFSEL